VFGIFKAVQHLEQINSCYCLYEVKGYQGDTVFELDLIAEIFLIEFCIFLILAVQPVSLTDQVIKTVLALQFVLRLSLIIHCLKNIGLLMVVSGISRLFIGSTRWLSCLFILRDRRNWIIENTQKFRPMLMSLANAFQVTGKIFYFNLSRF
jgi:hypothetical protein